MATDCVFCKIVSGEFGCYKLYEDDQILAFLDIAPVARGHCLIIPKQHYSRLDEIDGAGHAALAAVMRLAPNLGRAVTAATGAEAWNLLQNNGRIAGQAVDHVHFHIIPRTEGDGLGYRWPAGKLDTDEADELMQAIGTGDRLLPM